MTLMMTRNASGAEYSRQGNTGQKSPLSLDQITIISLAPVGWGGTDAIPFMLADANKLISHCCQEDNDDDSQYLRR